MEIIRYLSNSISGSSNALVPHILHHRKSCIARFNQKKLEEMNVTIDYTVNNWEVAPEDEDEYHVNTCSCNNKYWAPERSVEVVINPDTRQIVKDPRDMGTYNYSYKSNGTSYLL